ncbi:MAG: type VI secretion system tip protein TssI/VgrG [Candidatus Eisenbacteria bacterium]
MSPEAEKAFFRLEVDGVSEPLDVTAFSGTEGLSQPYRFEVELATTGADLAFDDFLGKPALLSIETSGDTRWFHGIVSEFEEKHHGPQRSNWTAVIVPRLWTLGLRRDCCIYQDANGPDVIKKVLQEAGWAEDEDFCFRLQEEYAVREYCVQYRETDLAFVSRLMEEDGIYYYFEHGESGHKMVISDHTGGYADISGDVEVRYREGDEGMQAEHEQIRRASYSRSLRPGKYTLTDYNFKKSAVDLESMAEASAEADYEYYDFPGRYEDTDHGAGRSNVRMQSLRAERDLLDGETNCRRFASGHKFKMIEHPSDALNKEYVLVRVEHEGTQRQAAGADAMGGGDEDPHMYTAEFEAIPSEVLWRPPAVTPRALVEGPQTAVVTGPAGEEIHCDEFGRVKVQFHWDRLGQNDDKSSCWIRVSQPWSGQAYGGMIIPRIGNEVVVSFLEGDPDLPLITGHVYNSDRSYGYTLPNDKTRTSLKTYSSPGGSGFNELRFEDAAGSEEIYLHGHKDWNIEVGNDRTQTIGHDSTHEVGNDEKQKVTRDRTREVGRNETVTVTGDQSITVQGGRTVGVTKDDSLKVDGARTVNITGADTLNVKGDRTTSVSGKHDVSVAGDESVGVKGNQEIAVDGNRSETVKGDASQTTDGNHSGSVKGNVSLKVDGDWSVDVKGKIGIKGGDEIVIECGSAKITLKKSGDVKIEGAKVDVKASGNLTLKGAQAAAN